jgi:hypothetical protein
MVVSCDVPQTFQCNVEYNVTLEEIFKYMIDFMINNLIKGQKWLIALKLLRTSFFEQ